VVKDKESNEDQHILVGKRVRHRYEQTQNGMKVEVWYTGKIISQVNVLTLKTSVYLLHKT
jgi:hypothetical protein